jgi:hypothetical protein
MAKIEQKSIDPNNDKMVQFVVKNTPAILNLLKGNIYSLSLSQVNQLYKISGLEASAQKMCKDLTKKLPEYSLSAIESFENGLVKLGLSSEENKSINKIYKDTIISGVSKASKILLNPIEEGKGFLYNKLLSEQTVCILKGVLNFKKSIDQQHPGLSDKIIAAAIPAITLLISAYSPAIGLAITTTGALSKAAEYIKTDNLEKTVNIMQADLDTMKKTKQFGGAKELGTILSTTTEMLSDVTTKNITQVKKETPQNKKHSKLDLKNITTPVVETLKTAQKNTKHSYSNKLTKDRNNAQKSKNARTR